MASAPHALRVRRDPRLVQLVLGLLRGLSGPMRWCGVQPEHVLELVRLRLVLDLRPVPQEQRSGMAGLTLMVTCLTFLFIGCFGAWMLGSVREPLWGLAGAQTLTLVWLGLTLVMEHSERLFDTSDTALVLPAPIRDRTLLFARITHIVIYISMLLACASLPTFVVGCFRFPWAVWVPVHLVSAMFTGVLAVCGMVTVFMLTLRTVGPARFRGVAAGLQMLLVFVTYIGIYAAQPLLSAWLTNDLLAQREPWLLLLPPTWFGGLLEAALGARQPLVLALAGAALLGPPLLLLVTLTLSGSVYAGMLGNPSMASRTRASRAVGPGLLERLGTHCTSSGPELAGWQFLPALVRRDHRFQTRVFPMFAMFAAMTLLYSLRGELGTPIALSMPLYALVPGLLIVLEAARWGETPEARWLFKSAPLEHIGPLLAGVHKSILVLLVLLPALAFVPLIGAVYGPEGWRQGAFALTAVCLSGMLCCFLGPKQLPFSARFRKQTSGTSSVIMGLAMMLAFGLGALHYLVAQDSSLQLGVQVLLLAALPLAWRALSRRRLPWPRGD